MLSILSSNIVSQLLSLVRSFTIPLFLGPVDFGRWNLLSVLLGYAANSHLGLLHGMGKMIPRLVANGDLDARKEVKESVLFGVIFFACCFSLVLSVCMLDTEYSSWIVIVSTMIVLQSIYIYYLCLFRADGAFNLLSGTTLFYSVALSLFVIGGGYIYRNSLDGAAFGMIVAQLLVVVFLVLYSGEKFRIRIEFEAIKNALVIGFPQMLIGTIDMIVYTADRWIVASNFSSIELGYYAFAGLFPILIAAIPIASSQVLYNYFLKFSVDSDSKEKSKEYILISVAIVSALVSFIVVFAHYALPFIVELWFEKYAAAVPLAQTLLFGSYFFSLSHLSGTYLIANDKHYRLIFVQLISVISGTFFGYFLMFFQFGLISVAYGAVLLYILYGLGYLYLAILAATNSHSDSLKYCVYISMPMLNLVCAIYVNKICIDIYDFGQLSKFFVLVIMPFTFNFIVFFLLYRSFRGLKLLKLYNV